MNAEPVRNGFQTPTNDWMCLGSRASNPISIGLAASAAPQPHKHQRQPNALPCLAHSHEVVPNAFPSAAHGRAAPTRRARAPEQC